MVTAPQSYAVGTQIGFDLTVPNAEVIRDFYAAVIGWSSESFAMEGFDDFFMKSPETGNVVAGICHARGGNADLPPQWLAYIAVDDLQASLDHCIERGGAVLTEIKGGEGDARYCVIRDPAGAVIALMQLA